MNKVKILYIVENLKLGGISTLLLGIAKEINKIRYEITIWSLMGGGETEKELTEYGAKVETFEMYDYKALSHMLFLVNKMRKDKIHIVHTFQGYVPSNMGRIAAYLSRVPIIIASIGRCHLEFKQHHINVNKILNIITDKIICCSNYVKEFIIQSERPRVGKLITIYNGVKPKMIPDNLAIIKTKQELNFLQNSTVIGTISFMSKVKGHKYLLEAIPYILDEFTNVIFLIVGDGEEMPNLKELTRKLNIEKYVIFTGVRKDIENMLAVMDIFVFPSIEEGFGNAVIEAMAMGKPIIATNICAFPETLENNKSGILVLPKDEKAIADAIVSLLKNPGKMKEISQASKIRYEQYFSAKIMTTKIENVYENLLSEKQIKYNYLKPSDS